MTIKAFAAKLPPTTDDTTTLKLIACASMLIDHIGKGFCPDIAIFQIIGRLAFPLFVYCMVVGFERTSNFRRYLCRLLLLAMITQPFYMAFFRTIRLNVLFTLAFGLASLRAIQLEKWCTYALILLAASLLPIEYGLSGVVLALAFCLLRYDTKYLIVVAAFMVVAFPLGIQTFALLSLPLIFIGSRNPIPYKVDKRIFYAFYPVHFAILQILRLIGG